MALKRLNPYINFNGTAAEAIKLYERVLGATPAVLMRMSEMPGDHIPKEHGNLVLHCELRIGDAVLMVSDTVPGTPVTASMNAHVALHFDDEQELQAKYDALAAGGKATFPVHDSFFGAKFGMLVDSLGVDWMFVGPQKAKG